MLTANTVVTHPDTGAPVVLMAGEELPAWADPLVGGHILDKPKPARRKQG